MARGFPVGEGNEGSMSHGFKGHCGTFGEGRRKGEHGGRVLAWLTREEA